VSCRRGASGSPSCNGRYVRWNVIRTSTGSKRSTKRRAGPWRHATNRDDFALLLLEFASQFGDTFHQDGRCIYDDRVAISLIRETGTAAASGDNFDNLAVYVSRLRPDGTSDRLTTVDLDYEHCVEFWERNPGTPSRDFS
jgi:hypothetical protein